MVNEQTYAKKLVSAFVVLALALCATLVFCSQAHAATTSQIAVLKVKSHTLRSSTSGTLSGTTITEGTQLKVSSTKVTGSDGNTYYKITAPSDYSGLYAIESYVSVGTKYSSEKIYKGVVDVDEATVYSAPRVQGAENFVLELEKTYKRGSVFAFYPWDSNFYIARSTDADGNSVNCFIPVSEVVLYTAASSAKKTGIIISSAACLYESPSATSTKFDKQLSQGNVIAYIDFNSSYYVASYKGKLCFIKKGAVSTYSSATTSTTKFTTFQTTKAYSAPSTSATVAKKYASKITLNLVPWDSSKTWYFCTATIDGTTKYVFFKASDFAKTSTTKYAISLATAASLEIKGGSLMYSSGWVTCSTTKAKYYLSLDNFKKGADDYDGYYQFANLKGYSGLTAKQIDKFLSKYCKGTSLEGCGSAFVSAAKTYGINEAYLVAHACLETGYGTSWLAQGNKSEYENTTNRYYNFYGYGATDSTGASGGLAAARYYGWTTPTKAIKGAANLIAAYYTYRSKNVSDTAYDQDTVYEMRFNPYALANYGYAYHQYASDIAWAYKIGYIMGILYENYGSSYTLTYDLPSYN